MHLKLEERLQAARGQSDEAMNALFEAVRPLLAALSQRVLPAQFRAKISSSDLVQEALAAAHASFADFRGKTPEEFLGWLRAILRNRAGHLVEQFLTEKRDIDREEPLRDMCQEWDTPSQNASGKEELQRWEQSLAALSEDYRWVIELRLRVGLPFDLVAEQMNRSEQAVRRLYARAMIRWQQLMESNDGA